MKEDQSYVCCNTDNEHFCLPLFLKLGWLPIHERIKHFRCLTVYKALNNLTPSYLVDLIKPFCYVHRINTRGSQNQRLLLPKVNTVNGKRSFKFLAANGWNSLDNGLRNTPFLAAFRTIYLKMTFLKMKT